MFCKKKIYIIFIMVILCGMHSALLSQPGEEKTEKSDPEITQKENRQKTLGYIIMGLLVEKGVQLPSHKRSEVNRILMVKISGKVKLVKTPAKKKDCLNVSCLAGIIKEQNLMGAILPRLYRDANGYMLEVEIFQTGKSGPVPMRKLVRILIPELDLESLQIAARNAARIIFEPKKEQSNNGGTGNVQILSGEVSSATSAKLNIKTIPAGAKISLRYKNNAGSNISSVEVVVEKDGYQTQHLIVDPHDAGQFTVHLKLISGKDPDSEKKEPLPQRLDCWPCWGAMGRSMVLPGWGQAYKNSDLKGGLFGGFFVASIINYFYWDQRVQLALTEYGASLSRIYLSSSLLQATSALYSGNSSAYNSSTSVLYIWQYGILLEGNLSSLGEGAKTCSLPACKRYQSATRNREYAIYLVGSLYLWNVLDALISDGYTDPGTVQKSYRNMQEEVRYSMHAMPDQYGQLQYNGSIQLRF